MMGKKDSDQAIQRYQHIFTDYMNMSKKIENCAGEDKAFYQDICFLFATKMKDMQVELAKQGFIICRQPKKEN